MIALQIIGLAFCLLGAAFFAGVETGVISINRLRLQHLVRRSIPGAATIRYFLTHSDDLLGTTLVGTNLLQVFAAVLAASIGHRFFGGTGVAAMGVLLTLFILVFCEYIPKAWFQASPVRTLPFAALLRASAWILHPLVLVVTAILHRLLPGTRKDQTSNKMMVTREELLHIASEGVQSGVLTPHETEMIHGVFNLTHKTCATLMIPRDRMISVPLSATGEEILTTARAHEFNRFPVYDAAKKTFTGVVHIFDILADPSSVRARKTATDYLRPPQQVAQYLPVDHLLPRMRVTRLPLFLVTDDRCEVIGLITLEDVLCEITGED